MASDLDVGKGRSIEILPEKLSVGSELLPGSAIAQIGEKMGFNDQHVKDMFPKINDFKGKVHFENIKNSANKTIGVFMVGIEHGEEIFRYKILYVDGKYVKADTN